MKTWLHFVGQKYYSRARFVREAKRYGVTRRVSLRDLRRMAFGDRVLLTIRDGASSLAFGFFYIETIAGLSADAAAAIRAKFPTEESNPGGFIVSRGCGEYIAGPSYTVKASIEEIAAVLTDVEDPGKPMVGGQFYEFGPIRLKDIPHRQGFREFNWLRLLKDVLDGAEPDGRSKYPVARGQFYATGEDEPTVVTVEAEIQEARDYKRREAL